MRSNPALKRTAPGVPVSAAQLYVSQRQMPLLQRPARFAQPVRLRALRCPVVVRLGSKFVAGCPRFAGQRTSSVDRPNQCPRLAAPRPCLSMKLNAALREASGRRPHLPSWRAVRALPASGRPVLIDGIKNRAWRRRSSHLCASEVVASSSSREPAALSEGCCLRRHRVACKAAKRINSIQLLPCPSLSFATRAQVKSRRWLTLRSSGLAYGQPLTSNVRPHKFSLVCLRIHRVRSAVP